jgi:hypothetical protein
MNLAGILPALLTLKIIYGYLCTASTSHFLSLRLACLPYPIWLQDMKNKYKMNKLCGTKIFVSKKSEYKYL